MQPLPDDAEDVRRGRNCRSTLCETIRFDASWFELPLAGVREGKAFSCRERTLRPAKLALACQIQDPARGHSAGAQARSSGPDARRWLFDSLPSRTKAVGLLDKV